jgi:hypothetical protein
MSRDASRMFNDRVGVCDVRDHRRLSEPKPKMVNLSKFDLDK